MAAKSKTKSNQSQAAGQLEPQVRKRLSDAMHQFKQAYAHGFKVLLKEIEKTSHESLQPFHAKMESLKMLDTPETFNEFLAQGKPLSELLGFSPEAIDTFYSTAAKLVAQKRFNDAKDAFFFLVTVAPQVSECWLGLGYAYGQCDEQEGAIQAFLRAIALSPHKADGYVAFARLFTALDDFPRAQKVCDIGMHFVQEHKEQNWAQELGKILKETKKEITQMASKH